MSLFAKNKPTKRIPFEGGFVELQHLSKGVKSEYQNRMSGLLKVMGNIDLKALEALEKERQTKDLAEKQSQSDDFIPDDNQDHPKENETIEIPSGMDFEAVLKKVNEAEYFKLSKGIKSWSEDVDITEETVQDLDEDLFERISKEIDAMNGLTEAEAKN